MTKNAGADRLRIVCVALATLALFGLLLTQFHRIQVTDHEKWARRAQGQHEGTVKIPFRRGSFYSNVEVKQGHPSHPQPFVIDVPKFHLHIDPASIPEEARAEICSHLLQLAPPPESQRSWFVEQFQKRSRNRQLIRWLDPETRDKIQNWWRPFAREKKIARNALFFVRDSQRSYPFGKLLGQVLHTIRDYKDEETKQGLPTGGLEAYFDEVLKGQQGRRWILRSPRHHLAAGDVIKPALDGADIHLTVNHCLQAIAEEEIEAGVQRAKAKGGWAILMDPHTGAILALAQYPPFYPARYREYFNDEKKSPCASVKSVTCAFEPGSTMKPLTLALCLTAREQLLQQGEEALFDEEEMVDVSDGKVPGRSRALRDVSQHRFLNMRLGLQKSSNVYLGKLMQKLIERMGALWYSDALRRTFGLGEKTGVELPGETGGFVPQLGRYYASGAPEWSGSTPYSLAMGYNLLASNLQMVRAYASIANGGRLVQPTLVKKIVRTRADGTEEALLTLEERLAARPPKRVLSPAVARTVMEAMKYVTKRGGSSCIADIPGFSEAGKSGTSEKVIDGAYAKRTHFSSFIGMTPAHRDRPAEVVLGIFIDEPAYQYIPGIGSYYFGGRCAAEVFRRLARRALEYLGVTPDDPCGYPTGDPRRDTEGADWHAQAEELREIYEKWNAPPRSAASNNET